jgi:hypothetical protein
MAVRWLGLSAAAAYRAISLRSSMENPRWRAGFLLFVLDEPGENAAQANPGDDLFAEAVGFEPATESCQGSPAGRESAGRV